MDFLPISADDIFDRAGRDNIAQLRTASGATDDAFARLYIPQLRLFAEWVQEIPLEPENFNQPLGAFRFGLTSAWLALRLSDQVIFVQGQSHERRTLDPQYRFAAFCACLASTILLVKHHLVVTAAGKPWSYLSPNANLHQLLKGTPGSAYTIGWTRNAKRPSNTLAVLALGRFFEAGMWESCHPAVCAEIGVAINPGCLQVPGELPLSKVVRMGMEKAREIEIKGRAAQYAQPVVPSIMTNLADVVMQPEMSITPTSGSSSSSAVRGMGEDGDEDEEQGAPAKPAELALSDELKAFTAHIRASKTAQAELVVDADGTMLVPAKFLQGAGVEPKKVFDWFKNGGFVVSVKNEAPRHIVLSAAIVPYMKVES